MTIKHSLLISAVFLTFFIHSQDFQGVYKIDQLLRRMSNKDTTYVVNFWATWCKPCIEELPIFDSLLVLKEKTPLKIILVNLDFAEELEKKVKPFLVKHKTKATCILLNEVNGNDFVNKISPSWSGAIPATLFKKSSEKKLVEKKMKLSDLLDHLKTLENK